MASSGLNSSSNQPFIASGLSDFEIEMLSRIRVTVNRRTLHWRSEVVLSERERLEFEIDTGDLPLDIYAITLELERDDVTQGIPVHWNTRRANNKVSTREWQQRMQEEQYAGDCSVTLLYRGIPVSGFTANILFQVSRLAEQHYEYMRDELREQNEKVLYSERGRTHEIAVLTSGKSPAAVRYEVVKAHYDRLIGVLPLILDCPHRELRRYISIEPASTMRSLSYSALQLAARSGASWSPIAVPDERAIDLPETELSLPKSDAARKLHIPPTSPVAAWQEKLKKMQDRYNATHKKSKEPPVRALPNRLPVPRLEESFDTYENRFLKMVVRKLVELMKMIEKQLLEEIISAKREQERSSRTRNALLAARILTNQGYIKDLHRMHKRLEDSLTGTFLEDLPPPGKRRSSVVLRENRYYRQIRLIESALDKDMNLSSSTVGLERLDRGLRLSSVNQLYEYWTTVIILQTMVERLGFTVVAKEGRPVNLNSILSKNTRFNYILNSGGSMELLSSLGKRVVVYYDREYRGREDQLPSDGPLYYGYYSPQGFGSTKRRPDIAIEIFSEGERVPRIVIFDATYSRDSRTLYAKYQYRDSIRDFTRSDVLSSTPARAVIAAWAIFPDFPNRLEHDEYRFGQLPLLPGPTAASQLTPILRRLLFMAGAIE
ncbi:MAG: DUF2357 domain-containing protein [Chloroflexi bacterium]|uniref:DUF2357 domain-containing protein n=1 Tax=Candidatus Chlorohelix allophototropha TaxID=3003348 RepID=A0A8T7M5B8_9CHLR|nr:DUF2357 domain-containing protein [Chloroflexota bacterium]WJW69219.1 restriction endonuclease-like protein [Chloroflexota bacterium L227-S17]